jgi:hypothetical protein
MGVAASRSEEDDDSLLGSVKYCRLMVSSRLENSKGLILGYGGQINAKSRQ